MKLGFKLFLDLSCLLTRDKILTLSMGLNTRYSPDIFRVLAESRQAGESRGNTALPAFGSSSYMGLNIPASAPVELVRNAEARAPPQTH